nr:MAG TPA: hypothetical protein [Caudoviricetes sp.]DAW63012.1 MAG TPA: hypothetical protein [Caudoviricetes sp.]
MRSITNFNRYCTLSPQKNSKCLFCYPNNITRHFGTLFFHTDIRYTSNLY